MWALFYGRGAARLRMPGASTRSGSGSGVWGQRNVVPCLLADTGVLCKMLTEMQACSMNVAAQLPALRRN